MHKLMLSLGMFFLSATAVCQEKEFVVPRLPAPITLDGMSNELAWESISPLPLVTQTPVYHGAASQKTEIRIAYDDHYFYASGRFYDSDVNSLRATSLVRDGVNAFDDVFTIMLDTYRDNENALAFSISPAGTKSDFAVHNDGTPPFSSSWNTFWDVVTTTTNEGWFAEIRIPWSSLRFEEQNERVTMGLIVWRWYPRNNETVIFPDIPPKWHFSTLKPSRAQDLVFEGIRATRPMYISPYFLGGMGESFKLNGSNAYERIQTPTRNLGLDVKYSVSSNLTLDVTTRTDFAQVEADDRQVNLTRFSLFFPEKRLFFLERSSLFDFSTGGPTRVFYSRRIGLSDSGVVPILGGIRLTGRMDRWDVGVLDLQTERMYGLPSENFGIVRVRKQTINQYSYLGGILTSRLGDDGSHNIVYGLDGVVRVMVDDYLSFHWAQSFDNRDSRSTPGLTLSSARAGVLWERRRSEGFSFSQSLGFSGPAYKPGMGYLQRKDIVEILNRIGYGWFAPGSSLISNHSIAFEPKFGIGYTSGVLEAAEVGSSWMMSLKSGASTFISIKWFFEKIPGAFQISEGVNVPAGDHRFTIFSAFYQSSYGNPVRANLALSGGTYYDGHNLSIKVSPAWSISRHLELSGEYQLDRVAFPARHQGFTSHITRARVKIYLSTQVSANSFVQLNTLDKSTILNIRFRYNPSEGNDFYLVYNETFNLDRKRFSPPLPFTDTRTVIVKYTHMFQL